MRNLLYIGNKLNNESSNITTIDTLGKNLLLEGYNVTFSSSRINKVFRLIDMVYSVIKNSKRIDYVLIDTYSTQNFYYAFIISQLCRQLKLKYIPILHGGDLPNRLVRNPELSKYIFKNAFINVSPSLYLKHKFQEFGFYNIEYIPNSIEIKNYPFSKKKVVKPKLFWLRSYKKIYNPLMAIKVVNSLKGKGFDSELCMVGPDGDGSFLYAQKLSRDLNVNVNFKLKMRKEDWIELSKDYNIFLNTTNFDNMPVSIIEAMALGFPIVSTNVGGIPKLITDGKDGLLVDKDDADAMADQVLKIVNDHDLVNKLAKNARLKAENFNWDIVKLKWFELFK